METYYDILNIHPQASEAEIRARFRFLANAYHPDKFTSPVHKAEAEREFKKINQAYQVLSNPLQRAEYDRTIDLSRASGADSAEERPPERPVKPIEMADFGRRLMKALTVMLGLVLLLLIVTRLGLGSLLLLLLLAGAGVWIWRHWFGPE